MARFVVIDDNGNKAFSKPVEQEVPSTVATSAAVEVKATDDSVESAKTKECFLKRWFTPRKKSQEPDVVYTLNQEGLEQIISIIAEALSDKFVTRDEIKPIVEHTIQRMVVSNDINKNKKKEGR